MELIRAEPTAEDARLVHRWRQDPEALAASFHDRPEPFETFYPRYLLRYFGDPQLPPYFLLVDAKRIGFVGFDREGELSIVIAPEKRRKGHALAALLALKPRLVRAVFARVKESNEQSIALFEKAGFTLKGRTAGVLHFNLDYKRAVSVIAEIGSNWRED
ncbi:MAG: GNAT family N-acetyltransferase, partial [Chlamydiia bacterium]|nr:GNAT family N-acetyltransferase [Chlamydiia bacterium]